MDGSVRRIVAGMAIGVIVLLLWLLGALDGMRLRAVDLGFRFRPEPAPPANVLVVGIDNESLKELGPLPWPRTRHAELIGALAGAGARAIAFDMWFADPARDPAEDVALAAAAERAGCVLFSVYSREQGALIKITRSIPALVRPGVAEAHVNVPPDPDQTLRRAEWETHTLSERFLFLPVALAARHFGVPAEQVTSKGGTLALGPHALPLTRTADGREALILDLPHTTLGNYVSYAEALRGRVSPDAVRGKTVIIGQVIHGAPVGYPDVWNTPRGRKYGVIMLGEICQQLIDGRALREAPTPVTFALVLALGLACPWVFPERRYGLGLLGHGAALAAVWGAFFLLMAHADFILDPVPLTAALLLSSGYGALHALRVARHEIIRDERALEVLHRLGETVSGAVGAPALVAGARPDVGDSFLLPSRTPRILLETIGGAVGARSGRLFLARGPEQGLLCLASYGDAEAVPMALAERVNAQLRADRNPFACADPRRELGMPGPGVLAMPLSYRGVLAGAVHLYDKQPTEVSPGRRFTAADLRLIATMSQQAMIGLENASLYEGMREIFLNATLALANAVDAKDPNTRGHSERVLAYSDRLARAAGLSEREVGITRMSAVLHDIGKIAIPDDILRKPARLTDEEFAVIRTHPTRGVAIIEPLQELGPLVPGIRQHHERYDGGGYPDGLRGKEISIYGRIICIADSFDAMTSQRYYREARNAQTALAEIERCAGMQFDPELAKAFAGLIERGGAPNLPLLVASPK
jgi:HD-GYP domain-containing protein (c-di-GMP phosphodiesterase class II)/CHASE2 domain-containing sensor protein